MDAAGKYELLSRLSCPLCGGTRGTSVLAVVDGAQGTTTVRAQCVRCHLFWSFPLDWLSSAPGLDDRVRHHVARVEPISDDDLIDVHVILQLHQGPLTELIQAH